MRLSVEARKFLARKGDKNIKKMLNKGGRGGVKIDFFKLLKRAVRSTKS